MDALMPAESGDAKNAFIAAPAAVHFPSAAMLPDWSYAKTSTTGFACAAAVAVAHAFKSAAGVEPSPDGSVPFEPDEPVGVNEVCGNSVVPSLDEPHAAANKKERETERPSAVFIDGTHV